MAVQSTILWKGSFKPWRQKKKKCMVCNFLTNKILPYHFVSDRYMCIYMHSPSDMVLEQNLYINHLGRAEAWSAAYLQFFGSTCACCMQRTVETSSMQVGIRDVNAECDEI